MFYLNYSEFYITNVCNLNCQNCNRYNNFAFSGHQTWSDHADQYRAWAEILDIKEIGILGGEPLLNPDFPNWLHGIAELWPNAKIHIDTNGTQLHKWPDLYDWVKKYQGRVCVWISDHINDNGLQARKSILKFLKEKVDFTQSQSWVDSYNSVRDSSWPDCNSIDDFYNLPDKIQKECVDVHGCNPANYCYGVYKDSNNVTVDIHPLTDFYQPALIFDQQTKKLSLHNSDPLKAIKVCRFQPCHHFIKGKLYKCGPVGILPEFIKQFKVDITDVERNLINSYQPASPSWDLDNLETFINSLKNNDAIDQCRFCPESIVKKKFGAGTKKIKIEKMVN